MNLFPTPEELKNIIKELHSSNSPEARLNATKVCCYFGDDLHLI
jgi:hypothetical protein